jgi:hypothetical protein
MPPVNVGGCQENAIEESPGVAVRPEGRPGVEVGVPVPVVKPERPASFLDLTWKV